MKLNIFHQTNLLAGTKALFANLKIPVNYVADEPTTAQEILQDTYKENDTFQLINDVYFVGMVDDAAFNKTESIAKEKIKSDYDGILLFAITLHERNNGLLPSRSQLAEISRAFNREFYYTPVIIVFKYRDNKSEYIAFSNTERLQYKQAWREGEKAGKVSLLRDINIAKPHAGHERIIDELRIPTSGKNTVDTFDKLYKHWQEVFSVSILNKKFYQELQSWYFWAIKEVRFPNAPGRLDINEKGEYKYDSNSEFDEAVNEHKAKNVIRLLTRILFIWFIKEKKLIPEEIFDDEYIVNNLLKNFTPQKPHGVFATGKNNSMYYRAILQNLFFATLNQEMGKREFRKPGAHQNVTNLMRYKDYFKDGGAEKFIALMESQVPFMNGGLFECLDKPHPDVKGKQGGDLIIYEDGFSDRTDNEVEVPDYLFFDVDEEVDISDDIGSTSKIYKQAKTKGLLELLKSYKFTITENTPIEEDVALDPELLGKVFENLLASYNPETKTTARKQTGSFYTPREIVNYMVDESLIAYLKNAITNWNGLDEKQVDDDLHTLISFDNPQNPFSDNPALQTELIKALDSCKILDPACGSGAFPMGVLQKMVHILYKVDPNNSEWKQRQIDRVDRIITELEEMEDADFRERSIKEQEKIKEDIEESFNNNELDYGRKLYLIENCIFGVDIQSIATQISKLRFFISLVVDQKINKNNPNFGVRPLPNLETKFVAANTLMGIDKPKEGEFMGSIYDDKEIKQLEDKLKKVRHKLFSSKSPKRKRELREEDEQLRNQIADLLEDNGWANETARQLASWDPYDQNSISAFFDKEWMFDISEGFNIVIGNPPYRPIQKYDKEIKESWSKQNYHVYATSGNIYFLFFEKGNDLCGENGIVNFITSNQWMRNKSGEPLRKYFIKNTKPELLVDFRGTDIFDNVAVLSSIMMTSKKMVKNPSLKACDVSAIQNHYANLNNIVNFNSICLKNLNKDSWLIFDKTKHSLRNDVIQKGKPISKWGIDINYGIKTGFNDAFYLTKEEKDILISEDSKNAEIIKPMLRGKDLARYYPNPIEVWLINTYNGKSVGKGYGRKNRIDVIENYPSIYKHLLQYKSKLEKRQDKGEHWTNLRSCDYDDAFQKTKLVFMNMSKDLIFSLDPNGEFYTNQKCFIATGDRIKYLTAFFNSRLFSYFFKDNFPELLGDVREVSKVYFEKIPVIEPNQQQIKLVETFVDIAVYSRATIKKANTLIESIIDSIINELYFHNHMKEKGIDIIQFVEEDLYQVLKGRDFENLTNNEKTEIIETLQKKWTHPDNDVRNRIKLFAVRSPEILKPILGS